MAKRDFRTIFAWMPWLTIVLVGGVVALFIIDLFEYRNRDVGILVIFLGMMFFTFAVDSLMRDNPEFTRKYFIQWLIVSGLLMFFALTVWVWY